MDRMSTSTLIAAGTRTSAAVRAADYLALSKPRIALLVLVAVSVAYCLASWGQPQPLQLVHVLLGTLLVAVSASALNQYRERHLDRLMERTADRPLPSGRLSPREVLFAGVASFTIGDLYLWWSVGWAAAGWAAATWVLYVLVYTPAKTRTSANTAIGAVAGALPVLIGWSAAGGVLDLRAGSLFLLVFLWQFPHFMAIAWIYREQYGRAGMRMLTVVEPTGARAGIQAVWGALALIPVSIVPALYDPDLGGTLYAAAALLLGMLQLVLAIRFCAWRTHESARWLMRGTLIYLPFVLLLLTLTPWL
jgi:protoheme IX farnesyltransferase